MNKIHLLCGILIFACIPCLLFGQDPAYTQFSNVPLYYNPAFTGLNSGLNIRFVTRNQDPMLVPSQRSYHLSADIPGRSLPGSGGLGLIFNADNDGVGFIANYNIGASFSARVPFNRLITGQAGIKAAWLIKHISWSEFVNSDRLHDNYGDLYDSAQYKTRTDLVNQPDFAVGGLVQVISNSGHMSWRIGASVDHLFEPDVSFLPDQPYLLKRKWIGHADVILSFSKHAKPGKHGDKLLKINPAVLFQHQDKWNSLLAGCNVTKFGLYGGLWYKGEFGDYASGSVAVLAGYRYVFAESMSIKFTYSYDKQITGVNHHLGGAHEISLVFEFGGGIPEHRHCRHLVGEYRRQRWR
jgi:type IX secretion system PorP/SprF family membrane protein